MSSSDDDLSSSFSGDRALFDDVYEAVLDVFYEQGGKCAEVKQDEFAMAVLFCCTCFVERDSDSVSE